MDGGAWWATVQGVAKSRTRLSHFTFTSVYTSVLISQLVHPPLAPVCRVLLYYSPYFTDDDPVMSDKVPQVTCLRPS